MGLGPFALSDTSRPLVLRGDEVRDLGQVIGETLTHGDLLHQRLNH